MTVITEKSTNKVVSVSLIMGALTENVLAVYNVYFPVDSTCLPSVGEIWIGKLNDKGVYI